MARPPDSDDPRRDDDETVALPRDAGETVRVPPPEDETWPGESTAETRIVPPEERRIVEQEVVEERTPPPPRLPPDRQLWPYLLALLMLVLAGLAALFFLTGDDEEEGLERRTVPALVRLPANDAVRRLQTAGFRSRIERQADDAPRGIVFAQRPGAGRKLEEGSAVTLFVSSGPADTTVPSVEGLPAERAVARLERAKLRARQRAVFSDEPKGVVVAQDPRAGNKVGRDSAVRINVSKGSGEVDVPDVVGQSSDDAGANIRKVGLEAKAVSVPSGEEEGTVIAQSPRAGSTAKEGATVRINVSDGSGGRTTGTTPTTSTETTETLDTTTTATTTVTATTTTATTAPSTTTTTTATTTTEASSTVAPPVTVPGTAGQTLAAAQAALQRAGLAARVVRVPSQEPAGTVVAQTPPAGSSIDRGETVRLNVSQGPSAPTTVEVPDVSGLDEADARTQLRAAGFGVQVIGEPTEDPTQEGLVLRQEPAAAEPARRGSRVTIYVGEVG